MKKFITVLMMSAWLYAESFYSVEGIKSYDLLVVNNSSKSKPYSEEILELMRESSKEMGVEVSKKTSTILAVLIRDIALGEQVGWRVDLQLGEYVERKSIGRDLFALTYEATRLLAPNFSEVEESKEVLIESVEELLEAFVEQYAIDNKEQKATKKAVTHESFAHDMGYETSYQRAIKRAIEEKKEVMLLMTTTYCPWCRKLEERVLSRLDIDKKIKEHYIPLMLNLDKDSYPKHFATIKFTPTIYRVDPQSDAIIKQFVGYSSHEEFISTLGK
jgi:thiol-disulfide isomerase/thioredoxin